jgi:hypothetical protein
MGESDIHKQVKMKMAEFLRNSTGASLIELPDSGYEADVFAVTGDSIKIRIEVITTPTKTHFLSDLNSIQQSDSDIKLVICHPRILANTELVRLIDKLVIAERSKERNPFPHMVSTELFIDDPSHLESFYNELTLFIEEVRRRKGLKKNAIERIKKLRAMIRPFIRPITGLDEVVRLLGIEESRWYDRTRLYKRITQSLSFLDKLDDDLFQFLGAETGITLEWINVELFQRLKNLESEIMSFAAFAKNFADWIREERIVLTSDSGDGEINFEVEARVCFLMNELNHLRNAKDDVLNIFRQLHRA